MKTIDTRGFSCPEPVLMTKKAIEDGEQKLEILIDTDIAKENISRFLNDESFTIEIEEKNNEFILKASK